jgi:hypothetical protein
MEIISLTPKNKTMGIVWKKSRPLMNHGETGLGVPPEIRPQVSQGGETRYYFGNTELQDGHWFVPNETGGYYVMEMDEIKNKYVIL